QTAIDEWEVTLQISGGGSTSVKPQIDIVLVTDYSDSMKNHVYGGSICGSTSFRADEETKRVCAKCGSDDIEWKGGIITGHWQCEVCRSRNTVERKVTKGWWCSNCYHYYEGETHPASCTQEQGSSDLGTRREIAQKSQVALVDSLVSKGINARIGVVQFGGLSKQKLALTAILNEDGTTNTTNVAAIKAAINAGKMSGLDGNKIDSGYYDGHSGGTNIEAGLIQGNKTLYPTGDSGSANQKFMILLSDGQPNVYSEDGSDSSRDGGYAATAAEKRATTIKNSHKTNFELYTVGFTTEVKCLENIASSSDKYYYAVGADLGSIFNNILNSILWVINNGTVADIMGGQVNLITKQSDISYSPTSLNSTSSLSTPTQPSVSVSGDSISWNTGSYVSGSATMTYKVKLDPTAVSGATGNSVNIPLNESAVLTYQNSSSETQRLAFPVPTAVIEIGTLEVTSSGLPQGVSGTTQSVGNTLVGNAAFPQTPYTVSAPIAAPAGYELKSVKVNGVEMTKTAFDAAYLKDSSYQLPVVKGQQTVEYVYGPISVHTVKIEKYDESGAALTGAVFTINQDIGEKAADQGANQNSTSAMSFTYGVNYTVSESTTPSTYNGVSDFTVTLKSNGTELEFVGNAPAGVTLSGLTIQVQNTRKAQHNVIVYYWDVTDSENPVALSVNGKTSDSIVKYEDESYNVTDLTNIPVANYQSPVVAADSAPVSGTMGDKDLVINVNYTKVNDLSYTIEYYYVGEDAPFDTKTVENVIHGTQVEDVVDSSLLAVGYKRDHVTGAPAEITENGIVIKVYYVEKEPTDVEIPVTHTYYTNKLDGTTEEDGSQSGASLVISVSEARETIVDLSEVGKLLTYNGENYDFSSIRVIGVLKDEFKAPIVPGAPVEEEIPEQEESEEEEPEVTTSDIALLTDDDEEAEVPSTTPDQASLLSSKEGKTAKAIVLPPEVEYTSDFIYQPEYDYEILLTYEKDEPKQPEPEDPEPEKPIHVIPEPGDEGDNNPPVIINDPTVPLAPPPSNLVTILDPNMPLGNLPQTGGVGGLTAGAGLVGLLGAVLNLFRKKEDK
ncbi:MAG: hypothetical protein PUC57_08205, partial [Oscillospiraceae bacterium]|nr:hypothetical protein [Oscillospiraceae bacterium]